MIEIEKPQIECIETPGDVTYGKYVVEPLERGYGTTLGNALRRIMLSSLPGTAPTSIKIAGVQHEFSTIPGVKEDVTEIVLNIKGLLTKLHCENSKTVYIEAVGPCDVKAGDIKADGEVEVLNPDMHIATLDNGATLNMEITLSHGRGYVPADRNKPQQNVIGIIAVGLHLHPCVQGQLHRGAHPRGRLQRLRQADAGGVDRRDHLRPGRRCPWAPRSCATTSRSSPTSPRTWAASPRWWRRPRHSGTRCWS